MNSKRKVKTKEMTFNKPTFVKRLNQFKAYLAIPQDGEIVDVVFLNNTIVLKYAQKSIRRT